MDSGDTDWLLDQEVSVVLGYLYLASAETLRFELFKDCALVTACPSWVGSAWCLRRLALKSHSGVSVLLSVVFTCRRPVGGGSCS